MVWICIQPKMYSVSMTSSEGLSFPWYASRSLLVAKKSKSTG